MSTDHTVTASPASVTNNEFSDAANVAGRDPQQGLESGSKGSRAMRHSAGQSAPEGVCTQQYFVELFQTPGRNGMQAFAGIEAITVKNQKTSPVCQLMLIFLGDFAETGFQHEVSDQRVSEKGIVVSDGQSDQCSVAGQFDDSADDVAAGRWP